LCFDDVGGCLSEFGPYLSKGVPQTHYAMNNASKHVDVPQKMILIEKTCIKSAIRTPKAMSSMNNLLDEVFDQGTKSSCILGGNNTNIVFQ
jgi:hypothetical protein